MATFSWADTARAAIASCLPCLVSRSSGPPHEHQPATSRDELEGLLQGAEFTDTETDADVLSLHSHVGRQDGRRRVKKKRRSHKKISLFGFDLFGRPLPTAEEHDRHEPALLSISTSTLDSDAAPLQDDAIAQLSAQTPEQRAADYARRERKRHHKHLQHAAALLDTHGTSFEGFPGSGASVPDDFGAFQTAPPPQDREFVLVDSGGADEADAEADFDAGSYALSAPQRADSGSGTRSRSSNSSSRRNQPHRVPLPSSSSGSTSPALPAAPPRSPSKKPKSSKKSKSATRSSATVSSSASQQPRSPLSTTPAPHVEIAGLHQAPFEGVPQDDGRFADKPMHIEIASPTEFEGVPPGGDGDFAVPPPPAPRRKKKAKKRTEDSDGAAAQGLDDHPEQPPSAASGIRKRESEPPSRGFPSARLARSAGFPSSGLGGRKNPSNMGSQGVFLARRGEDE